MAWQTARDYARYDCGYCPILLEKEMLARDLRPVVQDAEEGHQDVEVSFSCSLGELPPSANQRCSFHRETLSRLGLHQHLRDVEQWASITFAILPGVCRSNAEISPKPCCRQKPSSEAGSPLVFWWGEGGS